MTKKPLEWNEKSNWEPAGLDKHYITGELVQESVKGKYVNDGQDHSDKDISLDEALDRVSQLSDRRFYYGLDNRKPVSGKGRRRKNLQKRVFSKPPRHSTTYNRMGKIVVLKDSRRVNSKAYALKDGMLRK